MTNNTRIKDFFSEHAALYATFRPAYPKKLYDFIFSHLTYFDNAWDCATGNGQVASYLAKYFRKVYATDISQQQLDNARAADTIFYSVCRAEETNFTNHQFDLVTVGQAIHWFDLPKFFNEVKRVTKPGGCIAVWGYNLCNINSFIDKQLQIFYSDVVGSYWDAARKIVENKYSEIEFPFEQIPSPDFTIQVRWTLDQFAGYITTWSATQKFMKEKGYNPVPEFTEKIKPHWTNQEEVNFPVFLKLGKVH